MTLRTNGTGAQAGALGMFGADSILIRVPVLVGGRLPKPVSIVALIVEEEVHAPRIEVLCEGLLTVGSVQVGVYLLEGWGQRGLVGGAIAVQRASLEGARVLSKRMGEQRRLLTASERRGCSSFARDSGGSWSTRATSWRICLSRASKEGAASGSRGGWGTMGCLGGGAAG